MISKISAGRKYLPAALLSAVAFLGVVVVNGLANALPLNGANTGVLSDEIPNLFVPAGLTFSIWGLIYLLLAGYIVAVFKEQRRGQDSAWTGRDAALFLINMAANIGWIFAWHWRLVGTAMILMLVILGSLIALEQGNQKKLDSGGPLYPAAPSAEGKGEAPRRFFLTVPLRVYLGWISVATIANATAVLVKAGWGGFGLDPRFWTVLVIIAGLVVALGFSVWKRQAAAPLVVVWAYAGIVIKRLQTDAQYSAVVWIAALAAAVLILFSFLPGRVACPFRNKK
jgi:hypothetical protein